MDASAWTPDLEARLVLLRAYGLSWSDIGVAMKIGRDVAAEKGRLLGLPVTPGQRPLPALREALDRPARPPGHPACWGLITAGTVLEGAAYSYPVFL